MKFFVNTPLIIVLSHSGMFTITIVQSCRLTTRWMVDIESQIFLAFWPFLMIFLSATLVLVFEGSGGCVVQF